MDALRMAVIGTNWITGALLDAGRTVPGFEAVAVCSRSEATGREFAGRHAIPHVHTSVAAVAGDPKVDAVYIASPNSLHAPQAITLLEAGKHVLVEKPMGASADQVEDVARAARNADRVGMEAYVAPFEPNVLAIRDALPRIGRIRRALFAKDQYSSRYDALKAGQLPNIFNPAFAAGSLMDLGYYGIALSVFLFGAPDTVTATGQRLPSGVDGQGTILLGYEGFEVVCLHSKIAPGGVGSQIAGESGVLLFEHCSVPTRVTLNPRGAPVEDLTRDQSAHHMRYEVQHFLECVRAGRQPDVWAIDHSLIVARVLDEARRQVGVRFPSDA